MKIPSHQLAFSFAVGLSALFTQGHSALAYWSGPTYTISNRVCTPANNTVTTTTYPPQAGGSTTEVNNPNGATVSAKWTWTASPYAPNEQMPTDVYVLQYGKASWNMSPPAQGAGMTSEPSFQEASFSPRHKAKLQLIQTQQGSGTATNGLGHAQSVTTAPDGWKTGTSKGYKIVLLHPTNGVITTPNVTLLASATRGPGQSYMPAWQYNAQVMTLQITRNGEDVTYPNKPEKSVMVGEKNDMAVSVSPIPADIPPVTYQWSIPGDRIKNFTDTPSTPGNATAVPPVPATPHTGKKIAMTATDLQQSSVGFFWYNGAFAGLSHEVSVVVTFDGTPITLKAKCKVFRPNRAFLTAEYNKAESDLVRYTYDNWIRFSEFYPGVKISAGVTAPNIPAAQGQVAFEQKVSGGRSYKSEVGGTTKYTRALYSNALDSGDENPLYHREEGGVAVSSDTKDIYPNTSVTLDTSDQPGSSILSADRGVDFNESFSMYVMYKPASSGSIWVAIGKVDWSWSVQASKSGTTWPVNTYSPKVVGGVRPTDPTSADWFNIPEWDTHAQEVPITTYTPTTPW